MEKVETRGRPRKKEFVEAADALRDALKAGGMSVVQYTQKQTAEQNASFRNSAAFKVVMQEFPHYKISLFYNAAAGHGVIRALLKKGKRWTI